MITPFRKPTFRVLVLVILGCILCVKTFFGQTVVSSPSDTVQTVGQEQGALSDGLLTLLLQGATDGQVQAWQRQNAAVIQSVQQEAQQIAQANALQPLPYVTDVAIPPNSSTESEELITLSADLQNGFAAFHNQNLAVAANAGTTQVASSSTTTPDELAVFHQQNSADFDQLHQLAVTVANQLAQAPIPLPPPTRLPANASPALKALMTFQDQLTHDQIVFMNQYTMSTPEVRAAAIDEWNQQNASRFTQVGILAKACAQSQ